MKKEKQNKNQYQSVENLIKNQIEIKDAMIEKLHKELEDYRQDVADRSVLQFIKSIIKVKKDMDRVISSAEFANMPAKNLQEEYIHIFEDLTDLLEMENVDSYRTPAGAEFDRKIHAGKAEKTDNPELDKTIKESISEGYMRNGKVFIHETVKIYCYKEPNIGGENNE